MLFPCLGEYQPTVICKSYLFKVEMKLKGQKMGSKQKPFFYLQFKILYLYINIK
jgi:hypothetical protein